MSGRFRAVDLAIVGTLVLSLVSVGSTMLAMVGGGSQQALCAANLSKFGQALAAYEASWGAFPACDPYPLMPHCVDIYCRSSMHPEKWDPPHTRLLYEGGHVPIIPADFYLLSDWWQQPWGFYVACLAGGADAVPPMAICPSAILENVMSDTSPEIQAEPAQGVDHQRASIYHKYAACYTVNRLLRSAVPGDPPQDPNDPEDPNDRRFPRLSQTLNLAEHDNQFMTAGVHLDLPGTVESTYYVQAVNSDEVADPSGTLYMCDSRDYRIGNGDQLVDSRYGDVDISAGTWMGLHLGTPAASPLGARHDGKSNVLYVDGHVSDDNQTPRNQRGDLITASTFADFIDEYLLGTQHHLLPGGRWVDQTLSPPGSYAPGDDEPPTVTAVWPGATGIGSPNATHITITFSEQVLINETNVTVNGGAVTADAYGYEAQGPSFSLQFDDPLTAGTYQVTVGDAVTDRMGNQLDGDADGTAGGSYPFDVVVRPALNWAGGPPSLQDVVDGALDGDVIIIEPGIHQACIDFGGKAITVRSTDPRDPDVVVATVLQCAQDEPTVLFATGEGPNSILEGLTITHDPNNWSEGVRIQNASPTVRQCRIVHNQAQWAELGGGISVHGGSPLIEVNHILYNEADYGGGIYLCDASPTIRSNLFRDNDVYELGDGLYGCGNGLGLVIGNTFYINGIHCVDAARLALTGNIMDYAPVLVDDLAHVGCNHFHHGVPPEFAGSGNVGGQPLYVARGEVHIAPESAAVNGGSPWYRPGPDAIDMDFERRVSMDRMDIGADELQASFFAGSEPVADSTLAKTQNNAIELSFDGTAYLIGPGGLQIVPIGGDPNTADVGGSFTYELATAVDPNDTLRATETGAVLSNQTWYRLSRGEDLLVETFLLDVYTLHGDANNSGRVTTADYYEVKVHMGEYTDARCDLDGSGRVTTADYGVVKAHLGIRTPTKP
ncbi:MAG TPA: Ig-like domain-containing protein [Phycisphaerae bacterium]|nr:Ig-like domain-containing protein [Phycisphaerae bacterium]